MDQAKLVGARHRRQVVPPSGEPNRGARRVAGRARRMPQPASRGSMSARGRCRPGGPVRAEPLWMSAVSPALGEPEHPAPRHRRPRASDDADLEKWFLRSPCLPRLRTPALLPAARRRLRGRAAQERPPDSSCATGRTIAQAQSLDDLRATRAMTRSSAAPSEPEPGRRGPVPGGHRAGDLVHQGPIAPATSSRPTPRVRSRTSAVELVGAGRTGRDDAVPPPRSRRSAPTGKPYPCVGRRQSRRRRPTIPGRQASWRAARDERSDADRPPP